MKLPLFTPKEEAVPTRAETRVPLPRVMALVSAGHDAALEAFVEVLRASRPDLRVLTVSEGAFALTETTAHVDVASAASLASAIADTSVVTVGAVVPALFVPAITLAFARSISGSAFPRAAREVRDLFDATLSDARPALARHLLETSIFAA